MDAARALMLLLGIPFHVAESYRVQGGYDVASPDVSYLASAITALVHIFRMPAFFLMSGFFAAMILARRPVRVWIKDRLTRLGIPLLLGTLLLAPQEIALRTVIDNEGTYWQGLLSAPSEPLLTLLWHRWFLVTLLMFCLTLIVVRKPALAIAERIMAAPRPVLENVGAVLFLVLIPFAAIFAGKLFGEWFVQSEDLKALGQAYARYGVFFFLGYFIWSLDRDLDKFLQFSPLDIIGAAAALFYIPTHYSFYAPGECALGCDQQQWLEFVRLCIRVLAGLFVVKLFYFFMRKAVRSVSKTARYFVDASFCIYMVHVIYATALVGVFLHVHWLPELEMLIIIAATLAGSTLTYELMRHSRLLSYVLNGGPAKPRPTALRPATVAAE